MGPLGRRSSALSLRALAGLLPLVLLLAVSPAQAAFSGANGRIAFVAEVGDTDKIWSINPDGTDPKVLTRFFPAGDHADPSFSPDGTKIVFQAEQGVSYNIWVINADGSGLRQLTSVSGDIRDFNPHFLPSGQIIFTRQDRSRFNANGNYDRHLVRIDADGSNPTALTSGSPANHIDPAVNSAGRVVYASDGNGGALDIFELGGANLTDTAPGNGTDIESEPDIGPGNAVAYSNSTVEGTTRSPKVMLVGGGVLAGSHADGHGYAVSPAFSPDGAKIAYNGTNGAALWVMNSDGSGKVRITGLAGQAFQGYPDAPSWGPVPGSLPDGDGDGIADGADACPEENAASRDEDRNGCLDPSSPPAAVDPPAAGTGNVAPTTTSPLAGTIDRTAPTARLASSRRIVRAGQVIKRGFSISLRPSEDVKVVLEIFGDRKAARQLGLKATAARTRIARGSTSISAGTTGKVIAKLPRKARSRVRRATSVRLHPRLTLTDAAGNPAVLRQRSIVLKR